MIEQEEEKYRLIYSEVGKAASEGNFGAAETSQSQEDVDDLNSSGDVVRIIPTNIKAQLAFHGLVLKAQSNDLNGHHICFLVEEGKKLASASEGYDLRTSEGETTAAEASEDSTPEEPIYHGYFRVNLDHRPTFFGSKWIIGIGQCT